VCADWENILESQGVTLDHCDQICEDFKDKSKIVELPCELGSAVYALAEPCGGCEHFNAPMQEEYIERCKHCDKIEIINIKFSLDLYDEVGKTVFTSKEAAERALRERMKQNE
jgi:hypothetical protein